MTKLTISIRGMHCRSCEMLVEDEVSRVAGIKKVYVNHKRGVAEVFYEGEKPQQQAIEAAVCKAGYEIGDGEQKELFSRNINDYKELGWAFFILVGLYIAAKNFGLFDLSVGGGSDPSSLFVVFVVGLTAGLSTCMALVGGLILGISARHAEKHPTATPMQKFRPHLFFNAGRIASYALLGGLLGIFGSFMQLSSLTLGILTVIVGIVMLFLGLKLTGIFPRLENGGLLLPKGIARALGIGNHQREYSHKNSFIMGGLTFFLPCGFTQAMQLYAVSSGSFSQGALIMGLFALGTAPGLLGVGGLTATIKGAFARKFFKFAGVLVVALSLFNISNGYNLTGFGSLASIADGKSNAKIEVNDPNVKLENGVQVVRMKEVASGYSPNKFTIKKGVPVKWVIDAQAPYSCASSLVLSKMGIRKSLVAGENVIEFTPKEAGRLPFSCSMGMYTGVFNVVDENGSASNVGSDDTANSVAAAGGSCGGSGGGGGGGCGGCGGGKAAAVASEGKVQKEGEVQVIKTVYKASTDISPNTFAVKAGVPVRFEVDVQDDGVGCMSTIMIPGLYSKPKLLESGVKLALEFTPTEKGSYDITCSMGMTRGTLIVE